MNNESAACTSEAEISEGASIEALAAMLMTLSSDDGAALAKMLMDGSNTTPDVHLP
jgi:hypothetical protein